MPIVLAYIFGGVGLLCLTVALAIRLSWERVRPAYWASLPPGVLPPPHQQPPSATGHRPGTTPVRFEPPETRRIAEVASLLGGDELRRGPLALLMELGVRGYLRLVPQSDGDLLVEPTPPPYAGVAKLEASLLQDIHRAAGRGPVLLSRSKELRRALGRCHVEMSLLASRRGWSRRIEPVLEDFGTFFTLAWLFIIATGMGLVCLLGWGLNLLGVPGGNPSWPWLLGAAFSFGALIPCFPLGTRREALRAPGTARREQIDGFRLYLQSAEAGQIRFEEASSVFGEYLPMAIVFGIADHWVDVARGVRRAAAQRGAAVLEQEDWYAGSLDGLDADLQRAEQATRPPATQRRVKVLV